MALVEYRNQQFNVDLNSMHFIIPNEVILDNPLDFNLDEYTVFFGKQDWENLDRDIEQVEEENYKYFFLCLFTITIIDLTVFKYFNTQYIAFRENTKYPKFGWCGFGPHYENPRKILDLPAENGYLNLDVINLDEYYRFFELELENSVQNHGIEPIEFINRLLTDNDIVINDMDGNTISGILINYISNNVQGAQI
jgi:hypothetical protein